MLLQKIMFAAAHYAALAIFVTACWGCGRALLSRLGAPARPDVWLETAMATTLGVGLFICAFQWLAIAGLFTATAVLALVAAGVVAACVQLPAWRRQVRTATPGVPLTRIEKVALAALALVALPTLVAPLAPPAAFDELMYHLPYARLVAQSGSLGIHEWLRYPWFPYNYNLLYAGALMLGDDVLPHFLGALAGWLSVWMVYRLGVLHVNRLTACAGAAIWLGLGDYSNALIDMGVALFVLAACVALWWWRESPPEDGARWLALAAFCLGVAAGSKYQALTFLPLVAVFVIRRERRVKVWAGALVCFLVPCVYWYARNAITTGDPFNPIGANLFGFTNWNADDYKNQVDDVRAHAALPSILIWPVLLAPFSPAWKRSAAVRAAVVFCGWSLLVWVATSRYPRYMTSALPLIALAAALGWQVLLGWPVVALRKQFAQAGRRTGAALAGLLLAVLAVVSFQQTSRKLAMVSPTPDARDAFLRANVPGYAVMNHLREHATGRVYQIALSEAIYYGPDEVWGDTLGPWRYADFIGLPPAELARKLAAQGFEAIVIVAPLAPTLNTRPGFDENFALMYEQDNAKAYRIRQYAP